MLWVCTKYLVKRIGGGQGQVGADTQEHSTGVLDILIRTTEPSAARAVSSVLRTSVFSMPRAKHSTIHRTDIINGKLIN